MTELKPCFESQDGPQSFPIALLLEKMVFQTRMTRLSLVASNISYNCDLVLCESLGNLSNLVALDLSNNPHGKVSQDSARNKSEFAGSGTFPGIRKELLSLCGDLCSRTYSTGHSSHPLFYV